MKTIIPKDIKPYLTEISERLWSGHASVMVGAGFSKNAQRGESTSKTFLNWNELGDRFYEKLHGELPKDGDRNYLDVLKLANEVEAMYGRNCLDKLLKDELPDKEFQPSDLHEKLLQLPWTDVFTTNYDTLLERTAEKILQQRYETVVNKNDLVWSTKPRIIKLHGSFPSERPFIITEEDYRRYPKDFAPFVNTVQQSLLENTLCLIGFSGNDPNFLHWIGWIRDNLGKENSPKIFLIGVLSLSIGQRKLLEERNIISIDLSCFCASDTIDHYEALLGFVLYLQKQVDKENNLNWPDQKKYERIERIDIKKEIEPQYQKIIDKWKSVREKYPQWVILPEDRRNILLEYTEEAYSYIYHIKNLNNVSSLEFLYELTWRMEKCLVPIYNDWIEFYEFVIEKYNPFPLQLNIKDAIIIDDKSSTNVNKISEKWIDLQLSMLRFYREEGLNNKWNQLNERIEVIKKSLSPQLYSKYIYERCLFFLFSLDISNLQKELNSWNVDSSVLFWEAKKAGIIAEIGNVTEAEKILEKVLKHVRDGLNLAPVNNNYSLVSQEAYILQLLRYVKQSSMWTSGSFSTINNFKEYTERWNTLVQYKCDPWGELRAFETFLKTENTDFKNKIRKYTFKIGKATITHKSGYNKYALKAYAYLRYIEDIGIPIKLSGITFGKEIASKAIACISNYSPNWAYATLIRMGDLKDVDFVFDRKSLAIMSQEYVDNLANLYLSILEKSAPEIKKGDLLRNETFAMSLSGIIPEILARLCVKCTYETKIKILEFLKKLYSSNDKHKYKGTNDLVEFLINSFSYKEQYELIPLLFDFPLIDDREFIDPLSFIYPEKKLDIKINIDSRKINSIIYSIGDDDKSNRKVEIHRIYLLYELGLLTQKQTEQFGSKLWKFIDSNGFPAETGLYYFAFVNLPHPIKVNPAQLLKKYFDSASIPIQANKEEGSIGVNRGRINLFANLIGCTNEEINYSWGVAEINKLIDEIIEWWDLDKKYLLEREDRFLGQYPKSLQHDLII